MRNPLPLMHIVLLLSCFLCFSISSSKHPSLLTAPSGSSSDQMALLAFKHSMNDPLEALASWNESVRLCWWRGVKCGGRRHPGRVTGLHLSSLGLSGAIHTSVANLTFLRKLDLSNNSFHGQIPREMGHLFRLRSLNLSLNSLAGGIPASLSHCPHLRVVRLEANALEGEIPIEVTSMQNLVGVDLSQNKLTGAIPPSVGNLSSLIYLYLADNALSGSIPTSLSALWSLQYLDLSRNRLEGAIPPALGNLQRLNSLDISNNTLSGAIPPTLSNLSSVQVLYLSWNDLTGEIPPCLGGLPFLNVLDLARNNLTGGLPPSLGNLTALTALGLATNSLGKTIPPTIGNLISLTLLSVAGNGLTGTIPLSVYNLSSLVTLNLGTNKLSGTLPSNIGVSFPNLQVLSLHANRFRGSIQSSISNASSLQLVQLQENQFTGVVPPMLGTLRSLNILLLNDNELEATKEDDWGFLTLLANYTRIRSLQLGSNRFGGVLPHAISNLSTHLRNLQFDSNQFTGSIPEGIGGLVGLTLLDLGDNLLEGSIPTATGNLRNLVFLDLSVNQISGQIPSSMSGLRQVSELYLDTNKLQGDIPSSFGDLQNLQNLDLSYNELSGSIPKELISIASLSISLDLSHNFFYGHLPAEVGHLRNLASMDISENKLSGQIPTTLGECELLGYLGMQGNLFQGAIPQSFSKLAGLQSLDLSRNNLSGSIPKFLQNFRSLGYLNLSFNNFEGEVPEGGIFQNESAVFVSGNLKLCGGIQGLHLQPCSSRESEGHHRHIPLRTIIMVAVVALCLIILFPCLIFLYCRRRRSSPHMLPSNEMVSRITYNEIFKATDGFSSQNLVGVGSFGSVYKGNMDQNDPNGKFVAVKVLNLQQQGASKSFMAECEALKNIRHRNLLKILTSCSSIDSSGNDFKALVFEFMPNGSLDQWLHPVENENGRRLLSLAQRLNIAVDVAFALAYLHHHNYKPIAHCDLKPSNVLLDNDMTAHVSDFGLARFLTMDGCKNPSSSLLLRGSIGYVAPEYGLGCNASTKGDVFSYGVLLLEMITGRRPTHAYFVDGLTIHKFVEFAFPDHILGIVDQSLLIEDNENAYNTSQGINNLRQRRLTCLVSTARLGLMCSMESPKERMSMEAVTKEITTIRNVFLGNGILGRTWNSNFEENVASSSGFYVHQ